MAAWWLTEQGLHIEATNVVVDGGEIDIIARDGTTTVVVEVRTITGTGDPIDAVSVEKRRRVLRLSGGVRAGRVDFLGVAVRSSALEFHWVPG